VGEDEVPIVGGEECFVSCAFKTVCCGEEVVVDGAGFTLIVDDGVFRAVSVVYAAREMVGVVGVVFTRGTVRVHDRGLW
jgi:hypothetical protein